MTHMRRTAVKRFTSGTPVANRSPGLSRSVLPLGRDSLPKSHAAEQVCQGPSSEPTEAPGRGANLKNRYVPRSSAGNRRLGPVGLLIAAARQEIGADPAPGGLERSLRATRSFQSDQLRSR